MDKAIALARQIAAQEATAAGVKEIMARLEAIEAKLDTLLEGKAEKPAAKSAEKPAKDKAGA